MRVGVLVDPNYAPTQQQSFISDVQAAASSIRKQIEVLEAPTGRDIDIAFASLAQKPIDALLVAPSPFLNNRRIQLVTLATYHRVPAIYPWREAPADPLVDRLSFCVSLSHHEFGCRRETAVPPNCANETGALRSRQISREFVSARKLSLLNSRKVPELTEEFSKQKSQKHEIRQILNSWRRECPPIGPEIIYWIRYIVLSEFSSPHLHPHQRRASRTSNPWLTRCSLQYGGQYPETLRPTHKRSVPRETGPMGERKSRRREPRDLLHVTSSEAALMKWGMAPQRRDRRCFAQFGERFGPNRRLTTVTADERKFDSHDASAAPWAAPQLSRDCRGLSNSQTTKIVCSLPRLIAGSEECPLVGLQLNPGRDIARVANVAVKPKLRTQIRSA